MKWIIGLVIIAAAGLGIAAWALGKDANRHEWHER